MSRENVEIVRRVYEAAARRDSASVLALHDREVECDYSRMPEARLMGRGLIRGHEELRAWFREWNEAWESVVAAYEELIDAGDQVISVAAWRGLGRTSGAKVETPTPRAGVWTIQDGKVVRVVWFESVEEAREAAGLPD